VHPADVHDRRAAEAVLAELRSRYPEVESHHRPAAANACAGRARQQLRGNLGWNQFRPCMVGEQQFKGEMR
jgi:hypothetical protein